MECIWWRCLVFDPELLHFRTEFLARITFCSENNVAGASVVIHDVGKMLHYSGSGDCLSQRMEFDPLRKLITRKRADQIGGPCNFRSADVAMVDQFGGALLIGLVLPTVHITVCLFRSLAQHSELIVLLRSGDYPNQRIEPRLLIPANWQKIQGNYKQPFIVAGSGRSEIDFVTLGRME